jgi:hypothetical protein
MFDLGDSGHLRLQHVTWVSGVERVEGTDAFRIRIRMIGGDEHVARYATQSWADEAHAGLLTQLRMLDSSR